MMRRNLEPVVLPPVAAPLSGRRPSDWANVSIEGEELVIRLEGWRRLLAVSRGVRVPLSAVVVARHEPRAHSIISTHLRRARGGRTRLWRLGAYHGRDGWSFWACGLGRNAVLIETTGVRYRYVVVEVSEPRELLATVVAPAGGAGTAQGGA